MRSVLDTLGMLIGAEMVSLGSIGQLIIVGLDVLGSVQ